MKKININNLIWSLILLCYTIYFASLLFTGNINMFIHPKMNKYTIMALIVFIILTGNQILKIFDEVDEKEIKFGYLILIIPILLGIAYKPTALSGKWVEVRGLNLLQTGNINHEHEGKESVEAINLKDNIINLNNKNYAAGLSTIYNNKTIFKGKKIVFEGFVYKQRNIDNNQFIAARMVIDCCAADSQVTGLICKYDKSNKLKENQWVRVTGIIDTTKYMDENNSKEGIVPQILVESVEEIEEPYNKYIYN